MKASRAYIASLGTTGVLLSFALLLLVVVSAILAFRGWPGTGWAADDSTAVRIDGEGITQLAPVRFETASAPRAAARSTAGAKPRASLSARQAGGVRGVSRSGAGTPGRAGVPPAAAPAPQAGRSVTSPAAPGVDEVRRGLADTSEQVTDGVAGALGGVNTTLEQSVPGPGQTVSELVERSGGAAERQLPLPKLP